MHWDKKSKHFNFKCCSSLFPDGLVINAEDLRDHHISLTTESNRTRSYQSFICSPSCAEFSLLCSTVWHPALLLSCWPQTEAPWVNEMEIHQEFIVTGKAQAGLSEKRAVIAFRRPRKWPPGSCHLCGPKPLLSVHWFPTLFSTFSPASLWSISVDQGRPVSASEIYSR